MPTTPRGAPYPSLAAANDPPRDLQLLAEWADAQIDALDVSTFKRRALTLAAPFNMNTTSAGFTTIPELTTAWAGTAGRLYRITASLTSRASAVADVTGIRMAVSPGAVITGDFSLVSNSSPTTPGTDNTHIVQSFYTAPTTGTKTLSVQFARIIGAATVTVRSTVTLQAFALIEDIGAA